MLSESKYLELGMLLFWDDDNFDQNHMGNCINDSRLCLYPKGIKPVMQKNVMVLGAVSKKGDFMPPHIFP